MALDFQSLKYNIKLTHSYVITWLVFSCMRFKVRSPLLLPESLVLSLWLAEQWALLALMSSKSRSCSLAIFSLWSASKRMSGWFQIYPHTNTKDAKISKKTFLILKQLLFFKTFRYISICIHLAADTESFKWVKGRPACISSLCKAIHEFNIECTLQCCKMHQNHMFLLLWQLGV